MEAEIQDRVPGEWPVGRGMTLRVYRARLLSGTPQPLEDHDELRWLAPAEAHGRRLARPGPPGRHLARRPHDGGRPR